MLLTIFLAATVIGALTIVAMLYWNQIVGWFRNHKTLVQSDKDNIAVIVKQSFAKGKIREVHGVFNTVSEEVIDGEQYETEELDDELTNIFGDEDVVVVS